MQFVLDASVSASWAFPDEIHPLATLALSRVQTDSAIAPALWWYEIRNVLLVNERRHRISPEQSEQFLEQLTDLNIEILPLGANGKVLRLARKHQLTVYDAAYLSLAITFNAPLATLDKRLRTAAEMEGLTPLA